MKSGERWLYGMLDRLDQVIVAVSSAPGPAAVGIVRLDGPGAVELAARMFRPVGSPLERAGGGARIVGDVVLGEGLDLPAVACVFRAPKSYTRQDLVELQTVGTPVALEWVRKRAIQFGALPAQPGEFTARAFLHGAMDLSCAEAVAGLIRAQTDTQLRASRRLMDGSLHQQIESARDELAELLALVEADIDFAEEPIEFISPSQLRARLAAVDRKLDELLQDAVTRERLDSFPRILLLGAPNVGKSTLMNAMSGLPRSICAAIAGTTRDLLSAPIRLGRGDGVLLDAAGVDESDDPTIAQARAMTLAAAEHVDLICWVVDIALDRQELLPVLRSFSGTRIVVAANKCDLLGIDRTSRRVEEMSSWNLGPVCPISALRSSGIAELRAALVQSLGALTETMAGESLALTQRQQDAVAEALEAIRRGVQLSATASETVDCADFVAFELREALEVLGTVTGAVSTEDLLGRVFAKFCIGK